MEKILSMSSAVVAVINRMEPGTQFHGNELHDEVVRLYPPAKNMYPDTLLRMMRRHCRGLYRTADHNSSLYERTAQGEGK